eukprot:359854-Chlamydomonas_euryale.AAC.6
MVWGEPAQLHPIMLSNVCVCTTGCRSTSHRIAAQLPELRTRGEIGATTSRPARLRLGLQAPCMAMGRLSADDLRPEAP